jgi:hypothetical protein
MRKHHRGDGFVIGGELALGDAVFGKEQLFRMREIQLDRKLFVA